MKRFGLLVLIACGGCCSHWNDDKALPLLEKDLLSNDPEVRSAAAHALGAYGSSAKEALPQLRAALADPAARVRASAARAILRIDPTSAKDLIGPRERELVGSDSLARRMSVVTLGMIGADAKTAIPSLQTLLVGDDPYESALSAAAINDIDPTRIDITGPVLSMALGSESPSLRKLAVESLGKLGSRARAYEQEITKLLRDENESVRDAAATAIKTIRSEKTR